LGFKLVKKTQPDKLNRKEGLKLIISKQTPEKLFWLICDSITADWCVITLDEY